MDAERAGADLEAARRAAAAADRVPPRWGVPVALLVAITVALIVLASSAGLRQPAGPVVGTLWLVAIFLLMLGQDKPGLRGGELEFWRTQRHLRGVTAHQARRRATPPLDFSGSWRMSTVKRAFVPPTSQDPEQITFAGEPSPVLRDRPTLLVAALLSRCDSASPAGVRATLGLTPADAERAVNRLVAAGQAAVDAHGRIAATPRGTEIFHHHLAALRDEVAAAPELPPPSVAGWPTLVTDAAVEPDPQPAESPWWTGGDRRS